jgi:hypothetical protein
MAGSSEIDRLADLVEDEIGAESDPDEGTSRGERLRQILFWVIGISVVVAILGTLKWWGDQQQHAKLTGRSWPPEPVKVFFGR